MDSISNRPTPNGSPSPLRNKWMKSTRSSLLDEALNNRRDTFVAGNKSWKLSKLRVFSIIIPDARNNVSTNYIKSEQILGYPADRAVVLVSYCHFVTST
jgi:hypothetical protein